MRNKLQSSTRKAELASKRALTDEEKLVLVAKVSADAIYDWDMVAGVQAGIMVCIPYLVMKVIVFKNMPGGRSIFTLRTRTG